jgi:hypothetical protein
MQVLIYGPRKSGTTLFQRLLDGTKEIFVHPDETKIKYFIALEKKKDLSLSDDSDYYKRHSYYFRAWKKDWPQVDSKIYKDFTEKEFANVKYLDDYIELDIEASKEAMETNYLKSDSWAIKEVSGNTTEIIDSFLNKYPEGKVINVFRDPRRITSAVYRAKMKSDSKVPFKRALKIAQQPYNELKNLYSYIDDPRVLSVFYENIVEHTEDTMKEVADFLGISYSEKLTIPTINGENCIVPTSSQETNKVFKREKPLYADITYWKYALILFHALINYRSLHKYKKLLEEEI